MGTVEETQFVAFSEVSAVSRRAEMSAAHDGDTSTRRNAL